jgi:hypothetical protein
MLESEKVVKAGASGGDEEDIGYVRGLVVDFQVRVLETGVEENPCVIEAGS